MRRKEKILCFALLIGLGVSLTEIEKIKEQLLFSVGFKSDK